MANLIPSYFLVPTWDFPPPPSGPLRLGSVITSLKAPERSLYTPPEPAEPTTFSVEHRQVSFSVEKLRDHQFGIFTRFLSIILGLGVDTQVNWRKQDTSLFTFDSLTTVQFIPETDYLQACVAAEPVQRYLKVTRYRKPVYVITGLKFATGAKAKSLRTRAVGQGISAEVDGTVLGGVPLGGGSGMSRNKEQKKEASWEDSDDFVFAFRVRKVTVRKNTDVLHTYEEYRMGAMLDGAVEEAKESDYIVVDDETTRGTFVTNDFFMEELKDSHELVRCGIPINETPIKS